MRKKALLLIFTISSLIVFAQKKTIKGYFVDAQTHQGKYQSFILLHQDSLVYQGESDLDKGFKIKGQMKGNIKSNLRTEIWHLPVEQRCLVLVWL